MAICVPKRVFNEAALEAWFDRLEYSWEPFFTKPEINLGKDIFRNGEIRELELNEYDAIVHARFDQEECYAIIEWANGKFQVRSSTKDKLLGRALAVAGMYDIQDVVSEEIESLSPEKKQKREQSVAAAAQQESLIAAMLKKRKQNTEQARPLMLDFCLHLNGLSFEAYWKEEGKAPSLALKKEGQELAETNGAEREKLISLASLARKSGFKFNAKEGKYLLKNIEKIEQFVADELEGKWQEKFEIQTEVGVDRINQGVQEAEVQIDLEAIGENELDFLWNMGIEDEVFIAEHARILIRNCGDKVLLPKIGIVTMSEEKVELLATWKRWLNLYSDGKIPRYALFSLFGDDIITTTLSDELKDWQKNFLKKRDANVNVAEFLRPYQAQGVKWLAHICESNCHSLLADEMGLGKTVQVLSLIAGRDIYPENPNLIVCPASVVPVWEREVKRFFPHIKVDILKSGNDFFKCNENVLWIASYAQLRMHKFLLSATEFGYVILDEAQQIKNPAAKVTQACMHIQGKHKIVLSGTPLENKYLDIWTIFRFLMPGLLGTRKKFEEEVNARGSEIGEKIRKQIAPFVLRRTKADVLKELPGKTETDIMCPLTDVQKAEYQKLVREGVKHLGDDIPKAVKEKSLSFLTLLTRLRQVCCDPDLLPWKNAELEDSGKIALLVERLEEIFANGHKVVVFSQFVSLINRVEAALREKFDQLPIFQLTGRTLDRARPVHEFQNMDQAGAMLVSLRAGGTGITLHSADYVFLMDPWWNPAVEDQAIDRVHRMGQDKPVFVYRMLTAGTVEARIQKMKTDKKGIFSNVVGGMVDISNMKNYYDSLSELISLLPE